MKRKTLYFIALAFFTCIFNAFSVDEQTETSYQVKQSDSYIGFKVKYFELGKIVGQFDQYKGQITSKNGKLSSMSANIKTSSVTTFNHKRNKAIQQESLLNSPQFPNITFQSTSIQHDGNKLLVRGTLHLKHESHEITLKGDFGGIIENKDQTKSLGMNLKGKILRHNFGLKYQKRNHKGQKEVGDEIELIIHLTAQSNGQERRVKTFHKKLY